MCLIEDIKKELANCNTVWDGISYCKRQLDEVVHNDTSFIAEYCEYGTEASYNNPNLENLANLAEHVSRCVNRLLLCDLNELKAVLDTFGCMPLIPFGDPKLNKATILWHLILGFDLALQRSSIISALVDRGPFNDTERDGFGIYLSSKGLPLGKWQEKHDLKAIPELRYNSNLQAIMFYRRSSGFAECDYPTIAGVNLGPSEEPWDRKSEPLRIGYACFTSAELIGIDDPDKHIAFKHTSGKAVDLIYDDIYFNYYRVLVERPLVEAIKQDCHILIYPELVMVPKFVEGIKRYLATQKGRSKNLRLIVAGSTRPDSDVSEPDNDYDNICTLLDANGNVLGTCHKYAPYIDLDKSRVVESLAHRGKTCTIVDIEDVGRVLVGICKDMVSDEFPYFRQLVPEFRPHIVAVPAMSASLKKGFGTPLDDISRRAHAVCCVCNLCCSRKRHKNEMGELAMGLVSSPEVFQTDGHIQEDWTLCQVGRPEEADGGVGCDPKKPDCVSCLRIVEIAFEPSAAQALNGKASDIHVMEGQMPSGDWYPHITISPCPAVSGSELEGANLDDQPGDAVSEINAASGTGPQQRD